MKTELFIPDERHEVDERCEVAIARAYQPDELRWVDELVSRWCAEIDDALVLTRWLDVIHKRLQQLGQGRRGFNMRHGNTVRADGYVYGITNVSKELRKDVSGGIREIVNCTFERQQSPSGETDLCYYVHTRRGDDNAQGTSPIHPWRTIDHARRFTDQAYVDDGSRNGYQLRALLL